MVLFTDFIKKKLNLQKAGKVLDISRLELILNLGGETSQN